MLQNLKHLFQDFLAGESTCSLPSSQGSHFAIPICSTFLKYSGQRAKLLIIPGRAMVGQW